MTDGDELSVDELTLAINQDWEHARHAERSRFWFASVYSAITAGSLAIVSQGPAAETMDVFGRSYPVTILLVASFLGILALAGIFVTVKLGLVFHHYNAHARRMSRRMGIDQAIANPLYDHPNPKVKTSLILSAGPWFLSIYLLSLGGILGWMSYVVTGELVTSVVLALVALTVAFGMTFMYSIRKMGYINDYVESLDGDDAEQMMLDDY